LLLLLMGAAVAWNPTPHHEMKACNPSELEACQYIPGGATSWDAATRTFTEDDENGNFGAPLWDSIDTEWDQKFVDNLGTGSSKDITNGGVLRDAIVNGEVRIGRHIEPVNGRGDLTLPVPANHPAGSTERATYSRLASEGEAFAGSEEYLKMLHPDVPYSRTIYLKDGTDEVEIGPIDMTKAMRSGGFPMCPNYWDWWGGDSPGPLNLGNDGYDAELYKFPTKVVGSPLVGDPELHFCRKWQEKYDATCCTTYLDEDIQEEYEELTGSGYLGAHVFVQQFLCLPCHPMISCMIDENSDTLRIPLEFAKKLADKMEDFDRTGLKVKVGEHDDNLGPLRQDEHFVPSQHFARQRGTHGAPAPPFPVPNCASKFEDGMFSGVGEEGDRILGYWPQTDCTFDATENPNHNPVAEKGECDAEAGECWDDFCEGNGDSCGNLFEPDYIGRCECTGPGKQCSCIREFLMHLRPPGINGYDGLDLNIEIVEDDSCGVLYDLMAGSTADPLLEAASSNGVLGQGERLSLSALAAGMALTAFPVLGGAIR